MRQESEELQKTNEKVSKSWYEGKSLAIKLAVIGALSYLVFDSIPQALACWGAGWMILTFIKDSARKREEELNTLYKKLDTMTEKRTNAAISEMKRAIKSSREQEKNDRSGRLSPL